MKSQKIDSSSRWSYKIGVKYKLERTIGRLMDPEYTSSTNLALQFVMKDKKSIWAFQSGLYNAEVKSSTDNTMWFKYFQVPVNMRIDKFGFYFSGGPYLAYLYDNANYVGKNRSFSVGINNRFGYEFKIQKRLSFFAEVYRFNELRLWMDSERLGFASHGLAMGVNYLVK